MIKTYSGFDEITECVGKEISSLIQTSFMGERLYIPQKVSSNHAIARAIGLENAQKLCAFYGGDHVHVPTGKAEAGAIRDQESALYIEQRLSENAKISEIARELDVTERTIYNIRARSRKVARRKLLGLPAASHHHEYPTATSAQI